MCVIFQVPSLSEVSLCRTKVTFDARNRLHLATINILLELAVRGADSIVTDAGKLADTDVIVRLEVFVQRIGQFGRGKWLTHLTLHTELHIGEAVEQMFVGTEAYTTDTHILTCRGRGLHNLCHHWDAGEWVPWEPDGG